MIKSDNANIQERQDEEHLFQLIKQAGEDARVRKQKAMEQHVKKLHDVISKAISRRNNIAPI